MMYSHFQQIQELYQALHGKGDNGNKLVEDNDEIWKVITDFNHEILDTIMTHLKQQKQAV